MPAYLTTIADAVVTALNAATFSEPHKTVVAERTYQPSKPLEELGDRVHATVIKSGVKTTLIRKKPLTRQRDISVDVGVRRRVGFEKTDDADSMLLLTQEIENLFLTADKLTGTEAYCVMSDIDQPYSPQQASELGNFAAMIRLTFRIVT